MAPVVSSRWPGWPQTSSCPASKSVPFDGGLPIVASFHCLSLNCLLRAPYPVRFSSSSPASSYSVDHSRGWSYSIASATRFVTLAVHHRPRHARRPQSLASPTCSFHALFAPVVRVHTIHSTGCKPRYTNQLTLPKGHERSTQRLPHPLCRCGQGDLHNTSILLRPVSPSLASTAPSQPS